jgi:sulfhydrogenase subunit delta
VCVMVARGMPCLGPVTQAGCGGLCPAFHRGCFGCFGPVPAPNTAALNVRFHHLGDSGRAVTERYRGINATTPAFLEAAKDHDDTNDKS